MPACGGGSSSSATSRSRCWTTPYGAASPTSCGGCARSRTTTAYVTRNLASAGYVSGAIRVICLGVRVEFGPNEEILREPLHPYTELLIQMVALPTPLWNPGHHEVPGEVGNALDGPVRCRFTPAARTGSRCARGPRASEGGGPD
ncbi:MAG: oligopeptide/dipeptide ABC transporter ATP-binding protein [Thermoplasmata archaeon]